MADRMAVMKDGVIRQLGTPRELYEHPADRFTAEFLGDINFIPGEVKDGIFSTGFGKFPVSGDFIGNHTAAIRPERIEFAPADASGDGIFEAELISGSYMGDCCNWMCKVGDFCLNVREFAPEDRKIGDKVKLCFVPGRLMILE